MHTNNTNSSNTIPIHSIRTEFIEKAQDIVVDILESYMNASPEYFREEGFLLRIGDCKRIIESQKNYFLQNRFHPNDVMMQAASDYFFAMLGDINNTLKSAYSDEANRGLVSRMLDLKYKNGVILRGELDAIWKKDFTNLLDEQLEQIIAALESEE